MGEPSSNVPTAADSADSLLSHPETLHDAVDQRPDPDGDAAAEPSLPSGDPVAPQNCAVCGWPIANADDWDSDAEEDDPGPKFWYVLHKGEPDGIFDTGEGTTVLCCGQRVHAWCFDPDMTCPCGRGSGYSVDFFGPGAHREYVKEVARARDRAYLESRAIQDTVPAPTSGEHAPAVSDRGIKRKREDYEGAPIPAGTATWPAPSPDADATRSGDQHPDSAPADQTSSTTVQTAPDTCLMCLQALDAQDEVRALIHLDARAELVACSQHCHQRCADPLGQLCLCGNVIVAVGTTLDSDDVRYLPDFWDNPDVLRDTEVLDDRDTVDDAGANAIDEQADTTQASVAADTGSDDEIDAEVGA